MFQSAINRQSPLALSPLISYAIQVSKPKQNKNDKQNFEKLRDSYPTDPSTKLPSLTLILNVCLELGFDAKKITTLSTFDRDTDATPSNYPGVSRQYKRTLKEKCRSLLIELIFTCKQYPQQTENIRTRFNTCDIGVGKNCPEGYVEELDRITQSLSFGTLQSIVYSAKHDFVTHQAAIFFKNNDNRKYFNHLIEGMGDIHQIAALVDSVKITYNLTILEESRSKDHPRFSLNGPDHTRKNTKNAFTAFLDQQMRSQAFEDFLSDRIFNSWQMPDTYKALAQPKLSLSKNPEQPQSDTLYIDAQGENIQLSITLQRANKKGEVITTFSTFTVPPAHITKLAIHGANNLSTSVLQTDVFFSHLCTYLIDEAGLSFATHHDIIDDWQKHYKGLFSHCKLSDQHWNLIFSLLSFRGGVGQDIFARARPSASKRLVTNYLFEQIGKKSGPASNTINTLLTVQTQGIPSDDSRRKVLLNELLPHVEQHELFSWFTEQLATYEYYHWACNTLFPKQPHPYKNLEDYLLAEQAIIDTHWQSLTSSSGVLARIRSLFQNRSNQILETVIEHKKRLVDTITQKQLPNPKYQTYCDLKKLQTWYATGDFLCNPFSWGLLIKKPLSSILLLIPKLILLPITLLVSCYKPFSLFLKSFKAKELITDNSLLKLCTCTYTVPDLKPSDKTTPITEKQSTEPTTYAVPSKQLQTSMRDAAQEALIVQHAFFRELHTIKEKHSTSTRSKRFHQSQKNKYTTAPQSSTTDGELVQSVDNGHIRMQQLATFF